MSTELWDALRRIEGSVGLFRSPLPAEAHVRRLASDLPAMHVEVPASPGLFAQEIARAIEQGLPLSPRQVRQAPWCLWYPGQPLAQSPAAFEAIIAAIRRASTPRPFRTLATVYLMEFSLDLPGVDVVAGTLQQLSRQWPNESWSRLHESLAVFDPLVGPQRVAQLINQQDRPATEILAHYGIREMASLGGFSRAVTAALLDELARGGEPDHLKRLKKVRTYALTPAERPLFATLGGAIAEALLRPFVGISPDEAVRDIYLQASVGLFADPRLHPQRWLQIADDLRRMVISWLTDQALRQFLDVVDQIAREETWNYRRAFWEGLHDFLRRRGIDVQAWVAFGRKGAQLARQRFGQSASFATLTGTRTEDGKHVQANHAALLIRIGDVVVADWNENGKCHIWSSSSQRGCPRLFQQSYTSSEIQIYTGPGHHETDTELSWRHDGSPSLRWQRKIASRISRLINLHIPESVYRLRQ